ncbi:MAG: Abi family protein [Clostridiales bacterium]|nr:Abi family protein [Clostridiales bacterium]
MSNRIDKPMLSSAQLIAKMRDEKGITFKYTTEEAAETYLSDVNNYLRTAAYRQNYQKYTRGANEGKYIGLDFAYLQELSTIDMHFRFIIFKMAYDDCPIWVLCELLSFGDFIYLYNFYYKGCGEQTISPAILNLVKSLRNASAHNNCIISNLGHGASAPPREIRDAVKKIPIITTSQRQKSYRAAQCWNLYHCCMCTAILRKVRCATTECRNSGNCSFSVFLRKKDFSNPTILF